MLFVELRVLRLASETSSKGWKPSKYLLRHSAAVLPKLPLRDGNQTRPPLHRSSSPPSETSSKGWKQEFTAGESSPEPLLPKLPLRDGNRISLSNINRMSLLPKLPLRDGNPLYSKRTRQTTHPSETSSKGWKPAPSGTDMAERAASETSSKGWKLCFLLLRPVAALNFRNFL